MQFVGENGINCGGLSHELLTILCNEIKDAYWESRTIQHNVIALKVCIVYYFMPFAGKMQAAVITVSLLYRLLNIGTHYTRAIPTIHLAELYSSSSRWSTSVHHHHPRV